MFRPKMSFNSKLLHRVFSMTKTMNRKITWCVVAICNCLEMMCYSTRIFCDWISSGFAFCASIVWHIDEMASRTENIFKNLSMENKPNRLCLRTECTPMGCKIFCLGIFLFLSLKNFYLVAKKSATICAIMFCRHMILKFNFRSEWFCTSLVCTWMVMCFIAHMYPF